MNNFMYMKGIDKYIFSYNTNFIMITNNNLSFLFIGEEHNHYTYCHTKM